MLGWGPQARIPDFILSTLGAEEGGPNRRTGRTSSVKMPPGHPKIKWAPEMSFPNRLEVKAAQRGHITSDSHTCLAGGWQWGWALVGEEEEGQS